MAFKKGESGNPAGKPIGAKNKVSESLRGMISDFLTDNFETIQNDFEKLEPKDRVKLYCDLLPFVVPKLQTVSADIELTKVVSPIIGLIIEQPKEKEG